MKKALLIVMITLMAAASVLALTACSNPAGVYKFESVTVKGWNYQNTYSVGDRQPHGDEEITEDSVTLTLNKDGTYEFEDDSTVLNTKTTGTWEKGKGENGENLIIFDNKNFSAEYTADGLTFVYNDLDLIFYTYKMKKA